MLSKNARDLLISNAVHYAIARMSSDASMCCRSYDAADCEYIADYLKDCKNRFNAEIDNQITGWEERSND